MSDTPPKQPDSSYSISNNIHRIKKILYQSSHRGCKETDLILGSFIKSCIDRISDEELHQLEEVLEMEDVDIYDLYIGAKPLEKPLDSPIMRKLIEYRD
jgi:antitoxin CptB